MGLGKKIDPLTNRIKSGVDTITLSANLCALICKRLLRIFPTMFLGFKIFRKLNILELSPEKPRISVP